MGKSICLLLISNDYVSRILDLGIGILEFETLNFQSEHHSASVFQLNFEENVRYLRFYTSPALETLGNYSQLQC